MADEEWQMKAIHEQFEVFNKLKLITPYQSIPASDLLYLIFTVEDIYHFNLRPNNNQAAKTPREICGEIIKYTSENQDIKLSFVVVVTNIEVNGLLTKMPVFIILRGNQKIFIDINCTVFKGWKAFLTNNALPACQFCFPVGGHYNITEKLRINFASSPVARLESRTYFWHCMGVVVGVGVIISSFFFSIPSTNHRFVDVLLPLAEAIVPGIRNYLTMILRGITAVQELRSGKKDIIQFLPEAFKILQWLHSEFKDEIALVFNQLRKKLRCVYDWIKRLYSKFFGSASEESQHEFTTVTSRIDSELSHLDSDTEEVLEQSRRNHNQTQNSVDGAAIHGVKDGNSSDYVKHIFNNAKNESVVNIRMKNKDSEKLNERTTDLLTISENLATILNRKSLKDVQDLFEAISSIVKEKYTEKIETYKKMVNAARAAAQHEIDIEKFNLSLGIRETPEAHYWDEVIKSLQDSHVAIGINAIIQHNKSQKKILLTEVWRKTVDDYSGVYRGVGVSGTGMFTTNDLIQGIKEKDIPLNEDSLVINETSSMIVIRAEDLTIIAYQELNQANTSEGMVFIERMEA